MRFRGSNDRVQSYRLDELRERVVRVRAHASQLRISARIYPAEQKLEQESRVEELICIAMGESMVQIP